MDDPLDARDAKRMDRMEKVVRELRDIVFKAQKSGSPVVVQPADTDARMADLAAKIGDLEQSLTKLNGALETTTHELDQSRRENTQLRAQVKALGDRLTADEQKAAEAIAAAQAAQPPAAPEPAPAASPADAKAASADAFAKARQLMLSGDYDAAQAAFGAYVTTYPDTPKTPEANYWLGKTLMVRGDNVKAAAAFIGAIRGWPQTAWAPDAVVELSRALVGVKKPTDACQTLTELGRKYPKAPAGLKTRAAAVRDQAQCGAMERRGSETPDLDAAVGAVLDLRLCASSARPVAVALSGGGDSLALLLAADAWARRAGRDLIVLSVDHGLRPESAGWTAACAKVAARLELPFRALAWTGPKPTVGLPAAARAARHALLADAARAAGARVILIGHTADDVLEARRMRADGSSVPEPRAWSPSPAWPEGRGVFLARPLLGLGRADIRAWLSARGEAWIEDPANDDLAYARPRARQGHGSARPPLRWAACPPPWRAIAGWTPMAA